MENYDFEKDLSHIPTSFHKRVVNTLYTLPQQKESNTMKSFFSKRKLVIAVAAVIALVTTAYAVGNIKYYIGSSSSIPEYTTLPTQAQLQKDIGFTPITPKAFENGYTFTRAHISNSQGIDENNNKVVEFKGLSAEYTKDSKTLNICTQDFLGEDFTVGTTLIGTVKDIELYYTNYTNITVDVDYKLTEEDKAKEASGEFIFSCTDLNGKAPIINEVQGLGFIHNNIHYLILTMGNVLPESELIQMASEIIG